MSTVPFIRTRVLTLGVAVFLLTSTCGNASDSASIALSGAVSSKQDGPMEGVVVIAHREGDTILTAVSSDKAGHFEFPRDRLKPGRYTVTIRAAGYELPGAAKPKEITVEESTPARLNLSLTPVADPDRLASQLTTLEWLNSFPGTDEQKDVISRNLVTCGFCHSLERVARSTHTADEFLDVIARMQTYDSDHSGAERIQISQPRAPTQGLLWWGRDARAIAKYLAAVNLSSGKTNWDYPLKTLPRPTGKATKAIVTVFLIPRQPSVVHDLDVDSQGNVWYGNTGWDFIGKLDPRTGTFTEWEAPNFLPPAQPGVDRLLGVQDIQIDGDDHVWAGIGGSKIGMFDPKTRKWRTFDLPVFWKSPFLSPVRRGEHTIWTTGVDTPPDGYKVHEKAFRLDINTGKLSPGINLYDDKPTPVDPAHEHPLNFCYMMDQDKDGNFLCTTPQASSITRADAATGKSTMIPTPTSYAFPRRGYRDDQNRFWFSEFFADKIGAIDLNTNKVTEYPLGSKYITPYYTRPDRNGNIWISSNGSDRLLRLDPQTGEVTQYLMPVYYDARKVVVDLSAQRTTIWLPNKNTSQLVRIEVPD